MSNIATTPFDPPPVMVGNPTQAQIDQDIAEPMTRFPHLNWWIGFAFAGGLMALGMALIAYTVYQGIGVWVKGDGNGQLLNFRLESPKHLSHGARGDHFIKIDFTGWKYFELVEIESSEFSNYIWPDSGFYVYDSYRHTILFNI